MTDRIITYHSVNAPPDVAWLAYIEMGQRRLDVRFSAPTEEGVKDKVRAFWAEKKPERDANRARRGASKTKTEATP